VSLFRVFQDLKGSVVDLASGRITRTASSTIVTSLVDGASKFLVGLLVTRRDLSNQVVTVDNPNSVAVPILPLRRGWNGAA
jgi:large-conductance mechanosensitive channel